MRYVKVTIANFGISFRRNTGLTINYEKSIIFRIGSTRQSNFKVKTGKNFKWQDSNIVALGIVLDGAKTENGFSEIFQKMSAVLKSWQSCNITLKGKVTMINALVASHLTYPMQVMPPITNNDIVRI